MQNAGSFSNQKWFYLFFCSVVFQVQYIGSVVFDYHTGVPAWDCLPQFQSPQGDVQGGGGVSSFGSQLVRIALHYPL